MPQYNIAFARLEQLLPFLHTIATALFIGLGAGLWLFAKHFLREQDHEGDRYAIFMQVLRKFGLVAFGMLLVIATTGGLMHLESPKSTDPMADAILMTKWGLEAFLTLNIIYMSYHYKKACTAFKKHEFIELYESLVLIVYYFIPLSFVISAIAIYLGVAYRGF